MPSFGRSAAALVVLVGAMWSIVGVAQAQEADWNRAAVTQLAGDLAPAIEAIQKELRSPPGGPRIGAAARRDYSHLRRVVGDMDADARRLVEELQAGRGRDATMPIVERLLTQIGDARGLLRLEFRRGGLEGKIDATHQVLDRLASYYDL